MRYGSTVEEAEIAETENKVLIRVEGTDELEVSCWRTCADVLLWKLKESQDGQNEIVVEEKSLLPGTTLLFRATLQVIMLRR